MGFQIAFGLLLLPAAAASAPATPAQCQAAKLTAGDAAAGDRFGFRLALSGDTALIGAACRDDAAAGVDAGAAYVFERQAGSWVQTDQLLAGDAAAALFFGSSVAVEGDRAVVGAPGAGPPLSAGAAYVFERTPAGWTQTAKLTAGDPGAFERFGDSVAVCGDTVLVGADFDGGAAAPPGAVYVFEDPGAGWVQTAKLTASDAAPFDRFGVSVALAGETALVGANDEGGGAGAVYVFERGAGGFAETQKLTASDAAAGDSFGFALALDGDTALVGAFRNSDVGFGSGSAYVFERGAGGFTENQKITAADAAAGDSFGFAASLSGDGALVGAFGDSDAGAESGSAYVFARGPAGFVQTEKLTASDAAANDHFGFAVALSGDTVLVGADLDQDAGPLTGSAYVFLADVGQPLLGCPGLVSVSAGGSQSLALQAGAAHAAETYFLLGSASGTEPGIPIDGVVLPLAVPDPYFNFTLANPGVPPLTGSLGILDAAGQGAACFALPAASPPGLVGLTLNHAYALFDAVPAAVLASNAVPLALGP